jgi:hypothetical protein
MEEVIALFKTYGQPRPATPLTPPADPGPA